MTDPDVRVNSELVPSDTKVRGSLTTVLSEETTESTSDGTPQGVIPGNHGVSVIPSFSEIVLYVRLECILLVP